MKKIYIAQFQSGASKLATVDIKDETKEFYCVADEHWYQYISDVYVGRLVPKNKPGVFESRRDAIVWLHGHAERYIEVCQDELSNAKTQAGKLALEMR